MEAASIVIQKSSSFLMERVDRIVRSSPFATCSWWIRALIDSVRGVSVMSKDNIVFDDDVLSEKPKDIDLPYEIKDPIVPDDIDKMYIEKSREVALTGNKAVAIIDEPKSCRWCVFCHYRWSSPGWAEADAIMGYHNMPNTNGIMCNLMSDKHIVTVVDYDDETYKSDWCPLKPIEWLQEECDA